MTPAFAELGVTSNYSFLRGGSRLFVKLHTNQGIWGCGEGVDAVAGRDLIGRGAGIPVEQGGIGQRADDSDGVELRARRRP